MKLNRLSPYSVDLYIIRSSLYLGLIVIVCVCSYLYSFIAAVLLSLVCLLLCIFTFIYSKYRYKNTYYYMCNNKCIKYRRGVIFKRTIYIIPGAVRCTEVKQGALQRIYNVYTIVFYMTGRRVSILDISSSDIEFLISICKKEINYET